MRLIAEAGGALHWVARVIGVFWQVRPLVTLGTVVAKVLNRIFGLLALFLPLKVIILAGSEGVPRYFQFFIDPDQKTFWVVALSLGAVAAFVATLLLEALTKRLAEAGSLDVLEGANELAVASRLRDEARGYYAQFCGVVANWLIVLLGLAVLSLLDLALVGLLLGLLLLEAAVTALGLARGSRQAPGRFQRLVRYRTGNYLDTLGSLNFLVGFFWLLWPFVMGQGGNLLLAILSVLIMRQLFGALSGVIVSNAELWKTRLQIDPLVFRNRLAMTRENTAVAGLRQAFAAEQRLATVRQAMALQGGEEAALPDESHWMDSPQNGLFTFHLKQQASRQIDERHWLQWVYPKAQLHQLEHEDALFESWSRHALLAPQAAARFTVGEFTCKVASFGRGETVPAGEWNAVLAGLLTHSWLLVPPAALSRAYATSRQTLEGRLSLDYMQRMAMGVDTPEQKACFERFLGSLDSIKRRLAEVPLYPFNPDLNRANVMVVEAGEYRVMNWGRWSLEHIGYTVPPAFKAQELDAMLETVRQARGLPDEALTRDHLALVGLCRELEADIAKTRYAKALASIEDILANPLVCKAEVAHA